MRIRFLIAALLAATCAAFALAGPASATAGDGRAQLIEALEALSALDDENFQGTYRTTGELPVHFSRESRSTYSMTTAALSQLVVDGVAYTSMSQPERARASAAGHPAALWTYMPDDEMLAWDMTLFTGDIDFLATQGTLKRLGGAYVLSVISDNSATSALSAGANSDDVSETLTAKVQLDSRQRVVRVDRVSTYRVGDTVTKTSSTLEVEYGTADLSAPDEATAFPAAATSAFPTLDPLEYAAYATAEGAASIGIAQRGYVSADAIEAAALEQPTPIGLTAAYTANGLRYEMDGRSLCIEVREDRQAAVVRDCTD